MDLIDIKLAFVPRLRIWLLEMQASIFILNKCDLFLDFIHTEEI